MAEQNEIKVLDHGFVRLRNMAGPTRRADNQFEQGYLTGYEDRAQERDYDPHSYDACDNPAFLFDADDTDPANSARMSFDQTDSGRTRDADLRLADYLMRNKHWTPFESIEVWLEMKMPIFVARQFVRHRTASINEVSGRYVTLPAEWYIPQRVGGKAADKKQGQSDFIRPEVEYAFKGTLDEHCAAGYAMYLRAIDQGVAPEHARMLLSLNHYTHWMWKQDLRNLLGFLSLRDHPHAQIEAQVYARAIDDLIRQQLPETMKLYDKYVRMP